MTSVRVILCTQKCSQWAGGRGGGWGTSPGCAGAPDGGCWEVRLGCGSALGRYREGKASRESSYSPDQPDAQSLQAAGVLFNVLEPGCVLERGHVTSAPVQRMWGQEWCKELARNF